MRELRYTFPCWYTGEDIEEDYGNSYGSEEDLFESTDISSKFCNCGEQHEPIKVIFSSEEA